MAITKYIDRSGAELPIRDENALHKEDLAQGVGTDETKTMSQKAITEAIASAGGEGGGVIIPGEDGFSPVVELTKEGTVTTLKITDAEGTKTAEIHDGEQGEAGADGKTPEKGIDYFTEEDKTEMVNAVIAALPNAEGASF